MDEFEKDAYLTMVTKSGTVKRTPLGEYEYQRKGGKIAMTLTDGDELLFVHKTTGSGELLIATRNGMAVRFAEQNARSMGRTAHGVRGIRLREGDEVVGVVAVDEAEDKVLLTVTENGLAKRSPFEDFRQMKNRGGYGVGCHKLSEKSGRLAALTTVAEDDDIMLVTDAGTIIRTPVAGIPIHSRVSGGVIIMRLAEGAKIITVARLDKEEEIEEEAAEMEAEKAAEAAETVTPKPSVAEEDTERTGDEDGNEDDAL